MANLNGQFKNNCSFLNISPKLKYPSSWATYQIKDVFNKCLCANLYTCLVNWLILIKFSAY